MLNNKTNLRIMKNWKMDVIGKTIDILHTYYILHIT